jgi:DNA-binding transcriptional ArsR family regulator
MGFSMSLRSPRQQISDRMRIDPALLRVLADPIRSFIVYSLVSAAKTAKVLATEMGCPPTRLYYHLQQLEKHGLVFVERTRLVSGIREKHYRSAARDFLLDKGAFGDGKSPDAGRVEALLGFVFDQTRLEIGRGLADGRIDIRLRGPELNSLMAYRNVLKLSTEQAERLYSRLHAFWMEYEAIAKQPADHGQFYAFAVALYPNAVAPPEPMPAAGSRAARKPRTRSPR